MRSLLMIVAVTLLACESAGPRVSQDAAPPFDAAADVAASAVSFTREIYPMVKRSCSLPGCHDRGTPTNHLNDFSTAENTYQRWVGGPGFDFCSPPGPNGLFAQRQIVVPGHTEQSYLVEKLSSPRTDLCRDAHHPRMPPPPLPPWSEGPIGLVSAWIRDGAPFN